MSLIAAGRLARSAGIFYTPAGMRHCRMVACPPESVAVTRCRVKRDVPQRSFAWPFA